jgi:WD40 repeat protein/DNA-binding SARP family transcriptional activator
VSVVDQDPGPDVGSVAGRAGKPMQIHLLGPVEVSSDDEHVPLGGPKPRALLAMLALDAGSTVSAERLIDGLWGDEPPATAAKMVQLYVSQLRKAMAAHGESDAIATRGRGYQLQLGRERVDVGRFERLLAQGAAREALRLWREPALADVADEPFAAAEIRRLDELRTTALEVAIDQDLDAGRHREVLPELEVLLAQEPLRERLHAQRMLALYRSGRQAEALEAYREARATLIEQIGVEPGPELRRLHELILRQDPSLDPPGQEPAGAPLVGRDAELAQLRGLWDRARGGSGISVLVTGPPGIGKTRLVQEFAEEVRRDGGAVAYGELEELRGPTLLVLGDVAQAPEVPPDRPVLAVATAVEGEGETLPLAPLARDDVATLARYHAGPRVAVEPPVDRLLAESGGIPARVHRTAAAWARALATQRVGAAAARASAERAGWHLAGDDVATEVVELQTVRERAQLAGSDTLPECPFKGLASFDVEDAPVFFGREQLVADMIARLAATRLMGAVGPSGSGKSSALRAGLLAALADGVLPGSERWPQALIRPGAHPLAALERATAELPQGEGCIVAVDQFEEAFTACRDAAERAAFVDALVACARDARRRTLVLVAVRADFYGHCAQFSEFSRLLGANQVLVGPMRRHELRRAIELPARRAGLRAEPEFVDALLADVEGEPGALPLLSTALLELWRERDGRRLTLSAYERTGGVRGAVARLAEGAYQRLDPARREAARRILLRLAGEGGVRVRVPIAELPDDVQDVLSVLAGDRLITVGDGAVEVAHEALLREWPRLRAWLDEDADGRRVHRHLTEAARSWDAGGRDAGELYRGSRLVVAAEWAAAHDEDLNRLEGEFLAVARAASEVEAERRRRANRRLRALLGGVGALLVLAVAAGAIALSQRGQARDAARTADAQRLGAQALTVDELDRALLLARAGVALDDSVATRGNLLAALLRVPRGSLGVLPDVRDNAIYGITLSPRGDRIAIGDHIGEVRLFDTRTRRELASYRLRPGLVQRLAFSPDGATLAVAGQEPENEPPGALIDLLDARTLERRQRIVLPPPPQGGIAAASPLFTADGRGLTVLQTPFEVPQPQAVFRVDLDRGAVVGRPFRFSGGAFDPAYSSDRRRLFVTSEPEDVTYELDTADLRVIARHPAGGSAVALHPDADLLALGAVDGSMRFVELPSGRVHRLAGKHDAEVSAMQFSADGRTLVSGDSHGGVIAWDVEHRVLRERLEGHAAEVTTLEITPDGHTAITAGSSDGKVAFWDLDDSRRLVRGVPLASRFVADETTPRGVAVSPDDRTLAVTHENGTVELLDTSTLEPRAVLEAFDELALATDFSPDGRLLAVAGDKGELGLWDARTLAPVRRLEGLRGWIQAAAFSPNGRLIAAGDNSGDSRLLIWDVASGRQTAFESDFPPSQLTFSPDGRLLAGAGRERGVEVRDVASGRLVGKPPLDEMARSVAFSPDGKLLFVGLYNGTGTFLSTEDWKPAGPGIRGHGQRILNARFTPDGRTLATSSADGTVQLWDVASRRTIGAPLVVQRNVAFVATILSRDGSYLYALPTGTEGMRLTLAPRLWRDLACQIAGRELTLREWEEVLPEQPYRKVCA